MTFGSLFSGIGGIDLGLERAGHQCRWQVEIDEFCRKVLRKHWPEVPRFRDITKIEGRELERVDLICGGFPSQDLSQAGKRAGIEGSRSGLWFEFARIVGILRPRYVLIENVPGLLDYRAMPRVVGELARLGYVGSWLSLRASQFGASHLRKRVFIVAHDTRQLGRREPFGIPGRAVPTCPDADRAELADASGRGWRELREPSELAGRFADGSDEVVENARCGGRWRPTEPAWIDRRWPSGDDSGASGALGDSECARRDGSAGQELRTDGLPLQAARSGEPDGLLEDTAWNEQPGSPGQGGRLRRRGVCEAGEPMADASDGFIQEPGRGSQGRDGAGSAGQDVSNTIGERLPDAQQEQLSGPSNSKKGEQLNNFVEHSLPAPMTQDGPILSESDLTSLRRLSLENAANRPKRRLNPRFVEWLMGFPIGWTEL